MAVLVNFKICDNAKECSGIGACPTGAFAWDDENQTIIIKDELCINCGKCECCPVDAIKVTHSDEEYKRVKKEIEEDPRSLNDLFIDRYGAVPISELTVAKEENIENILTTKRPVVLELYSEDSIQCLLKSIPIKELLERFDVESNFAKIEVTSEDLLDKYNVKELPALVFIKDQNVVGTIEGYYTDENSREVFTKIDSFK